MIRIFSHYLPKSLLLIVGIELAILVLSIYLVAATLSDLAEGTWTVPPVRYVALFAVITLVAMVSLGLYRMDYLEGLREMMVRLFGAFLVALALMGALYMVNSSLLPEHHIIGISVIVAGIAIASERLMFFKWSGVDIFRPRVLVLGTGSRAAKIDEVLGSKPRAGNMRVVGYLAPAGYDHEPAVQSARLVRAGQESLADTARRLRINEIVVAVRDRRGGKLPIHSLLDCRTQGIKVTDISSFFERECGQVRLESVNPSWLTFGDGYRRGLWRDIVKRLFDVVVSAVLLVVTTPVMLVAAAAVLLESGRPIFYCQTRVGQNERIFRICKFRSMRSDAEDDGQARWATTTDDRVTRVGQVLRKLRIDELPQIFNVLKGDMSFVGPRPERPEFVEELKKEIPYYWVRHTIKPGLTGWAQVRYPYGASVEDAIEKLQYDLYYVKNHTLFLDLMIVLDTIQVVLSGKGAR